MIIPPTLLTYWPASRDPTGWLVSEKLEGVRLLWDGLRLRSRAGRVITAPAWWTAGLPPLPLDGELWAGRGTFAVASATARGVAGADWRRCRFGVFESPTGGDSFLDRWRAAGDAIQASPVAFLVPAIPAPADLRAALAAIHEEGGEGLVLRWPGAPYVPGRTGAVCKLRRWGGGD